MAILLVAAALVACRAARESVQPPAHARHLVLVTIDTLRADHLGAYGYREAATPHLDGLAREGAIALQASSHVPLTRPSHVSLFTGHLPTETGIRDNISPAVLPSVPLLAEVLKKAGFATGAFVSSIVVDSSSGLDRGFDVYADEFEGGGGDAQFLSTVQKKGDVTLGQATTWLEKTVVGLPASGRLFLWLHLYDPHDPYEAPEPYASRHREHPYDGEIAWSDELVGRLDSTLARLGLKETTALLVTSDHGEGLGDHGETLHGFFVYQSTLSVPFFVRGPGVVPGTRLSGPVRLVDVFPTVLDLMGVPLPPDAHPAGRSLAAELRGGPAATAPAVYAESLVPLLHFGWSDLRVLRDGRFKYIQAPRPELYDLASDPGERTNLASAQPARVQAMGGALAGILDAERTALARMPGTPAVPTELLEKLGALGYVGGAVPAQTATPGADPKDRIQDFRFANDLIRQGLLRLHDRDYAASVECFRQVLARQISSFEIHFYMARGLFGLQRYTGAARHFAEAARRAPAHGPAWEGLAESLGAAGDSKGALEALRRGEAALPQSASLRAAEGRLLRSLGRRPEARRAFEAALPLAPRNGLLRVELGELLRDMGEVDEAIKRLREAADLEPGEASYWNSLGMTLGGNGRMAEAEQAFREACRLDAKSHRYFYNLGLILLREGRADEARPFFEQALRLEPTFTPARERLRDIAAKRAG